VGDSDVSRLAENFCSAMNILTFTSLWPNAEQPNFGVFVKHRVVAMARLGEIRVVAPVPHFPKALIHSLPPTVLNWVPAHWLRMARVAEQELTAGLETFHPRYLVTPKIGMSFYGGWMARGAYEIVSRLHRECPIDLIDAHYIYPDGYAATLLGQRLNIPVFLTARGSDINLFSRMPLIRQKIVKALHQATGIITVSQALKQRIIELGIAAKKIIVIPNGVDREVFHPLNREEARQKLSLNSEDPIILTVAALVSVKGIDRLIDAMALLTHKDQKGRTKLFVIGEGSERGGLESQISNLKLQDRVFLLGGKPQAELATWYSAADLFCLASHCEGCPNVVIEAMACGLPIVATDAGGVGELIDQSCGHIMATPTVNQLKVEIGAALATNWDRRKIAERGGARSWANVAEEVIRYFAERRSH
jgi:glycosyltransferase involved in cell wall biosynthesis